MMTMPHLMNCSHLGEGWCLDCVSELQERHARLVEAAQAVIDEPIEDDGQSPFMLVSKVDFDVLRAELEKR